MDHSNNAHSNFVNAVQYSTDGNKIVSVSSDKKIQFYDGVTGQPSAEIPNAHAGNFPPCTTTGMKINYYFLQVPFLLFISVLIIRELSRHPVTRLLKFGTSKH